MTDIGKRFSPDYATARARFRAATAGKPGGAIPVAEPDLTIDWAWTGDPQAQDVLVISSGLHGVEGFPGSAAQLEMLEQQQALGDRTPAVLWVHVLNPWGMANLRRVNVENVDLNRNFIGPDQEYKGGDPGYARMDAMLNPPTPPSVDLFYLRAGWQVVRYGFKNLKNAIAAGQYDFPRGLFYGGARLQPEAEAALALFGRELQGRRRVVHLDLHSALGPTGHLTPVLEGEPGEEQLLRARSVFGQGIKTWDAADPDAYPIRGGMTRELARRLAGVRYDGLTCEYGTKGNLAVVAAMRDECRLHFYSGLSGPELLAHPIKRAFVEAYSRSEDTWKEAVIRQAFPLYQQGARLLSA